MKISMRIFRQKEFFRPFIAWFLIFVWYALSFSYFFSLARLHFQDFTERYSSCLYQKFFPSEDVFEDIVIVDIDSASMSEIGQRWPWNRKLTADLAQAISFYQPEVIAFDIVFFGQSDPEQDFALESALRQFSPVILACKLGLAGDAELLPASEFKTAAGRTGFIDLPTLRKGIARRMVLAQEKGNENIFSFPISIAAAYYGLSEDQLALYPGKGLYLGNKRFIPSTDNSVYINYLIQPEQGINTVSAFKVMAGTVPENLLKDKVVIVGTTEQLEHDYAATPLGVKPGVVINADMVAMLLSGRFIREVPMGLVLLLSFILGALIIFFNVRYSGFKAVLSTGLIFLAVFFSLIGLRLLDIRADLFSLLFLLFFAWLCSAGIKYGSLLYFSQRVKDLAVRDPHTGFFTPRFFTLKLDEQMKNQSLQSALAVFTFSDYNKLVVSLGFEEIRGLFKSVGHCFESRFKNRFPQALFSRIFSDSIAVFVPDVSFQIFKGFVTDFLPEIKKTGFKAGDRTLSLALSCRGVFKNKGQISSSGAVLAQVEAQKDKLLPNPGFVLEKIQVKVWDSKNVNQDIDMLDFLVSDVESKNRELEIMLKDLIQSKKDTEFAYFETIRSLVKALEEKDTYTQGHSERVARYARAMAEADGLSFERCDIIYKAGLLHDIGKIGVPDYILRKKEKLTDEDYNMIKRHVLISAEILRPVKHFQKLIPIVLAHHERYDGTGYPYGLGADMISEEGLILAVVDAFDAITCGRGYKAGLSVSDAIIEMEKGKGTQFCPKYVDLLKELISSGKLKLAL